MRSIVVMLAGLLTASPAPAVVSKAASAIASPPGAVMLHLSADGQSVGRADVIKIYVPVTTHGATTAEARAANKAAIDKLSQALVAHGIERKAISLVPRGGSFGFIGNEAYDEGERFAPGARAPTDKMAGATLLVTLADYAAYRLVQDTLDAENQAMQQGPLLSLSDDSAARRAAIADALAKARREADAYAGPLGLRVDRITSISNVGEVGEIGIDPARLTRLMVGDDGSAPGEVVTHAQVWVDFVLVPR